MSGGKRDYARRRYDNIGLPRGWIVDFYQQEAALRGVPYATHLADLLADRAQVLTGQGGTGLWFPRGMGAVPGGSPLPSTNAAASQEAGLNEELLEANLDAFLGMLDEDASLSDAPTEPSLPIVR